MAYFARKAVLGRPVQLVGDHRDGPAAIILAHAQQPLEPFLNAWIIRIACLDEQCHDRAGVVGCVLVGEKPADIPFPGLAGEDEFGCPFHLRVGAGHSVMLN